MYNLLHFFEKNGFFVDIGANSPIRGNNTYFFEKNRNWSGIAIDPLPKYIKEWANDRKKTKFVSVACGNHEGKIKFVVINSNQGGWEDMLSASRKNVRKEDLLYPHKTITVPIKTLNSILTEGNIKSIDFISSFEIAISLFVLLLIKRLVTVFVNI
jgi:FkbM family methyltransferase